LLYLLHMKALLVLLSLATLLATPLVFSRENPEGDRVRARAEKLFTRDRDTGSHMPGNMLVALSISLEFGDYRGAEGIMNQLEALPKL
jgi:hypothetical protein